MKLEIVFLGTGGGRFATVTQKRKTGGIRILAEGLNLHLDPGPGSIVYSLAEGLDPRKINALLVSHSHLDHYDDAEVLIEAMTYGVTKKRGLLAASKSVLVGNEVCGPSISKYHQSAPKYLVKAELGSSFQVEGLNVLATEAHHTDPDTVGFRIESEGVGDVAYTSDTEYFEGIGNYYRGVRLLILCVMRPSGRPWKGHMTTDDAVKIVSESCPEAAVITHFGTKMILGKPMNEAKIIERKTGVRTIAAFDGMSIVVNDKIEALDVRRKRREGLERFLS